MLVCKHPAKCLPANGLPFSSNSIVVSCIAPQRSVIEDNIDDHATYMDHRRGRYALADETNEATRHEFKKE
jgi:hypothetical protein